ncbi:MAG: hypothetical protein HY613_02445 [Candidatus Rokubacteria bacterium]|nr:hypothetical protein [Candidatus Rokubacteria bacterium]
MPGTKGLFCLIDEAVWLRFKIWLVQNRRTMADVVQELIEKHLAEQEGQAPRKRPAAERRASA